MVGEQHQPQRRLARYECQVADEVTPAVGAAAAGGHAGVSHVAEAGVVEVRLPGDQAHVAAEGALAVQRTLRTLENLDGGQVDDAWVERARHRRVVNVEAGGAGGAKEVLPGDA